MPRHPEYYTEEDLKNVSGWLSKNSNYNANVEDTESSELREINEENAKGCQV